MGYQAGAIIYGIRHTRDPNLPLHRGDILVTHPHSPVLHHGDVPVIQKYRCYHVVMEGQVLQS